MPFDSYSSQLHGSGHADWFAAHVPPGVQTFEEGSEPLGTAGGLYNDRASPDFDGLWRFVGLSTMDRATVARIGPDTEDLYRDLWRRQLADGEVRAGAHLQRCIVDGNARFDLLSNSIVPTERS